MVRLPYCTEINPLLAQEHLNNVDGDLYWETRKVFTGSPSVILGDYQVPDAQLNGVILAFDVPEQYVPGSTVVIYRGNELRQGVDYTETGPGYVSILLLFTPDQAADGGWLRIRYTKANT